MRHIHQLQTAWLVFPSAEHTRFQHVLGVMHLASRWIDRLYDSLRDICSEVPSRGYCETLLRMAGEEPKPPVNPSMSTANNGNAAT